MLCGYLPFVGKSDDEKETSTLIPNPNPNPGLDPNPNPNPNPTQETNILRGNYAFKGRAWADVSDQAKDFISRLLVQNPKARLSGKQALHHPWIVGRAQAAHGLEP